MEMRFVRSASVSILMALLFCVLSSRINVAHADGEFCQSRSSAQAYAYSDPNTTGASSGGVGVGGYSLDACVGLAQTEAILQAGFACQNAGIPAGLVHGLGYAVVSWSVAWSNDQTSVTTGPGAAQQYDCGDTFL